MKTKLLKRLRWIAKKSIKHVIDTNPIDTYEGESVYRNYFNSIYWDMEKNYFPRIVKDYGTRLRKYEFKDYYNKHYNELERCSVMSILRWLKYLKYGKNNPKTSYHFNH
jgi:hypothetical protein